MDKDAEIKALKDGLDVPRMAYAIGVLMRLQREEERNPKEEQEETRPIAGMYNLEEYTHVESREEKNNEESESGDSEDVRTGANNLQEGGS